MLFVRPTLILVFDRLGDELFCIAPLWPDRASGRERVEAAGERIDEALRKLAQAAPAAPSAWATCPNLRSSPSLAADDYRAMVLRAKDYIEAGDVFQVVLAQRFTCPFPLPPLALYRALRRVNPSPFLYFLDLPGFRGRRLEPRDPGPGARMDAGDHPPDRRHPSARCHGGGRPRGRGQPARRSQGTRRAPDAARPRPQ